MPPTTASPAKRWGLSVPLSPSKSIDRSASLAATTAVRARMRGTVSSATHMRMHHDTAIGLSGSAYSREALKNPDEEAMNRVCGAAQNAFGAMSVRV